MLKLLAELEGGGNLYLFGLPKTDLDRLQFNNEPIFFDFGYAGFPKLFGLILYFDSFEVPEEIDANIDAVKQSCLPFINEKRGVTGETLLFFPIAKSIMTEFRSTPIWGFEHRLQVSHPNDMQFFFSGKTEEELLDYFRREGLITPQTKQTYKGFEKRK
ncbi:MAG: hypothetical protein RM021_017435 [Nostoc sp. EkiNYC01]|nr:hypothetical protein [Nostoc sp. EkiNYC01]